MLSASPYSTSSSYSVTPTCSPNKRGFRGGHPEVFLQAPWLPLALPTPVLLSAGPSAFKISSIADLLSSNANRSVVCSVGFKSPSTDHRFETPLSTARNSEAEECDDTNLFMIEPRRSSPVG
jgi:hypothetical protein